MQYAPHTNTTASLISERVHSLTTTSRAKKQRRMAIIIWLCSSTHLLNYLCDWAARNKQCNESTLFDMVLHTRNFIFIGKYIGGLSSTNQERKQAIALFMPISFRYLQYKGEKVIRMDFYLPHIYFIWSWHYCEWHSSSFGTYNENDVLGETVWPKIVLGRAYIWIKRYARQRDNV